MTARMMFILLVTNTPSWRMHTKRMADIISACRR